MCGIAGLLDPTRASTETHLADLVGIMAATLSHRGPDGGGTWVEPERGVAFGHRRLSVIDVSEAGIQPMASACGRYTIAFNGEVYNFRSLRKRLQDHGHAFRGSSDTEVLAEIISCYGVSRAVELCNGMFAAAVWDQREDRLHLIRDRVGEKPLYYGWVGKKLAFASELKALSALPGFNRDLDPISIDMFMRHTFITAPRSIYRDVRKLPAGTILTVPGAWSGALPTPSVYWSMTDQWLSGVQQPFDGDNEEVLDELESLLADAVEQRMVADVPLGAFLSGGIDSALIVALMQTQSVHPIKTYTVAIGDPAFDESVPARSVADYVGTEHTELTLDVQEAIDLIPELPRIYDEPFADPSQIPTTLIARAARHEITVGMSGDGGDELFAGYNRYRGARLWGRIRGIPRPLRRTAAAALTGISADSWDRGLSRLSFPTSPDRRVPRVGDKMQRLAALLRANSVDALREALAGHWEGGSLTSVTPVDIVDVPRELSDDPVNAMMLHDLVATLPDDMLVKVDRATMSVGLEARLPLLDYRLVEFAARVPSTTKLRGRQGKWPLRQVLGKHLPPSLWDRPKQGFDPPIGDWLRGPLREWAEDLLTRERLEDAGLGGASSPIIDAWQRHLARTHNEDYRLWAVLSLIAWNNATGQSSSSAVCERGG